MTVLAERFDGVIERLDVLDIDRGHHVDAGVEQLQHIFVTLAILSPRNVGVGQFVNRSPCADDA